MVGICNQDSDVIKMVSDKDCGDMAWNSNSPGLLLSEFRLQHIGRKEETITLTYDKKKKTFWEVTMWYVLFNSFKFNLQSVNLWDYLVLKRKHVPWRLNQDRTGLEASDRQAVGYLCAGNILTLISGIYFWLSINKLRWKPQRVAKLWVTDIKLPWPLKLC